MKMDQQARTSTTRLFNVTIVDVKKDDIEEVKTFNRVITLVIKCFKCTSFSFHGTSHLRV